MRARPRRASRHHLIDRADHQRGACSHQQVAVAAASNARSQVGLHERLAEGDRRGLPGAAAVAVRHRLARFPGPLRQRARLAAFAAHAVDAASVPWMFTRRSAGKPLRSCRPSTFCVTSRSMRATLSSVASATCAGVGPRRAGSPARSRPCSASSGRGPPRRRGTPGSSPAGRSTSGRRAIGSPGCPTRSTCRRRSRTTTGARRTPRGGELVDDAGGSARIPGRGQRRRHSSPPSVAGQVGRAGSTDAQRPHVPATTAAPLSAPGSI